MEKSSSQPIATAAHARRTFCKQYGLHNHNQCLRQNALFTVHCVVLTLVILSYSITPSATHSLPSAANAHDDQRETLDKIGPSTTYSHAHEPPPLENVSDGRDPHRIKKYETFEKKGQGKSNNLSMVKGASDALLQEKTARVFGVRVEKVNKGVHYEDGGVSSMLSQKTATVRLFGEDFTQHTIIRFVTQRMERGVDCDDVSSTRNFQVYNVNESSYSALANIELPPMSNGESAYYMCVRESNVDMPWIHQGPDEWLQIKTHKTLLPLWVLILFVVVLLLMSGLFSGLNLGLMALDKTEMKIIANTGTTKERRYAKIIQPIRDKGNYLLCSLLLGNVMVNSTLTILLDDISSGLVAIVVSTIAIVILGEIIPQALCSRHGLAVGAKTVYLTKFFMLLTFPLSYPISVLLDKILGEDIGNVYNRDRLKELIKVTHGLNQLDNEEVHIISGALDLKQKTVKEIMTKLETVFMLPVETILDYDTVSEIMTQGYSRIPVYEGSRHKIVSLLFTKDLALYDPDDKMPLKRFCQFYNNNNNMMFVEETTTLDVLFKDFKQGDQGHMAFVRQVTIPNEDVDPDYEVIGLVTMEDVIEEIIQAEINDETDVYSYKNERSRSRVGLPALGYGWGPADEPVEVAPNLCLAAYQFLITEIKEFDVHIISKNIFQRLLSQNFFFQLRTRKEINSKRSDDPSLILYEKGVPCDYFVLILEGRVQCETGKENLQFESGPFSYFGIQALQQNVDKKSSPKLPRKTSMQVNTISGAINGIGMDAWTFLPDYTVRATTDVTFLRISRSIYLAALQATEVERTYLDGTHAQHEVVVNFEEQIDKMRTSCQSFSISGGSSSFGGDTDSITTETDDYTVADDSNYLPSGYKNTNRSQHLNGSPMHKRKPIPPSVLGEIILTPNALLSDDVGGQKNNAVAVSENISANKNYNGINNVINDLNKKMKNANMTNDKECRTNAHAKEGAASEDDGCGNCKL